ncbi:NAC domain-containing protein 83-like [Capsicum chacoense]
MSGEQEVYYDDQWKQDIPPGFRFAPTDAELLLHYLRRKVNGESILPGIIHEVDVYECNPYHLQVISTEEEFTYFFTSRGRKHPNGSRTDRNTRDGKGYWKMTSKLTNVYADKNDISSYLGKKNTLVYFVKAPKGKKDPKTNWIMHEFELAQKKVDSPSTSSCPSQEKPFNDYVVCRVYNRQVKDKRETDEEKDLIDSLIGSKPVMTDHNDGEAEQVLPSTKRKFEPKNETITCDHPHAIAMAINSNYFYASHELQAATMLSNTMTSNNFDDTLKAITSSSSQDIVAPGEGVLGVEGISDQARAIVYQEHMYQQSPHIAEKQNSGLVDRVEIGANDAQEGPHNVTTRRVDEIDYDNISLGLANNMGPVTMGDLWERYFGS